VFVFHLTWRSPILTDAVKPVTGHLDLGVEVFFILSGFLVFGPYAKALAARQDTPRLGGYVAKRGARILPGYWLVLAVVTLLGPAHLLGVTGVLKHASLSYLYFENRGGEGLAVAWTLVVEISFYVFVPIAAVVIALLPGRHRTIWASLACIAFGAWALHYVAYDFDTSRWIRILPPGLFTLGAGMLLTSVARDPEPRARVASVLGRMARHPGALLATAGLAFVALVVLVPAGTDIGRRSGDRFAQAIVQGLIAFLLCLPVLLPSATDHWWRRFLGLRPIAYVGVISYGLYLWHIPVLRFFRPWVASEELPLALLGWTGALAVSLALASASWHLVEKPVLDAVVARVSRREQGTRPRSTAA
jgi:peptidoglycan/LPS O-acetylase OafA/YrhL